MHAEQIEVISCDLITRDAEVAAAAAAQVEHYNAVPRKA